MATLVGYIAAIWVTHFIPLSSVLTVPFALTGWLFLPGLYVWARLRRIDTRARPPVREMFRPWALTAALGALAASALFLAVVWDVPSQCPGPLPLNCFQRYSWTIDSGHYFHSILEGPQMEIDRDTYIHEVGFDLRSASAFGVLALCGAWIGAVLFRPRSTGSQ